MLGGKVGGEWSRGRVRGRVRSRGRGVNSRGEEGREKREEN